MLPPMPPRLPHSPQPASAQRAQQAWLAGQKLARQGRWHDAAGEFRRAARLDPRDALYGVNLADALLKTGRSAEALAAAEAASLADPQSALALALRVNALVTMHRHEEVVRLIESAPASLVDPDLLTVLGSARAHLCQPVEAVNAYLQALVATPAVGPLHYRLGLAFNDLGMKSEAAECFRTGLLLGLGSLEAGVRDLLAFYEREICDWRGGDTQVQALCESIARLPDDAAVQNTPFAHVTLLDDPAIQLKAARACARYYSAMPRLEPRKPVRRERLRIGYVSADFHRHATSYLMAQVLERHDRSRFEVFVYSHGRSDGSAMRQRIEGASEHFADLQASSIADMAHRIRDDEIDILVDLKGYTQHSRPPLFAMRAAPLQVSYLGFPGTTGADYIDYVIGDPVVTPLEHAPFYSEKIAQLPGCYQCNDGTRPIPRPPSRSSQGLPEDGFVFCAFNQPYKISPEVFDVWCRLLNAVPGSVLWLLAWNKDAPIALRREAQARGVEPSRIIFAPSVPQSEHLDRIGCADIFLDTWPCNAHTTASDALWAGLPVLTLSGRTFASRVAGSLMRAVGLPELVCDDVAGYEGLARELASDRGRLEQLRARVRDARHTSSLFDGTVTARGLELVFERMWERALSGQSPEHLPAS
jgi:predicted O-linked N-acetylglucosamine transferase (SPINDLY family)